MHYHGGNRAHYISVGFNSYNFGTGLDYKKTADSATKHQKLDRFVEQKNRELFEQKNTIPNGLDSRNYCRAVSRNQKI